MKVRVLPAAEEVARAGTDVLLRAVRAQVRGPEDPEWPCSFLHHHPQLEVLVDPPAGAGL